MSEFQWFVTMIFILMIAWQYKAMYRLDKLEEEVGYLKTLR
jgi:hypothetical protein